MYISEIWQHSSAWYKRDYKIGVVLLLKLHRKQDGGQGPHATGELKTVCPTDGCYMDLACSHGSLYYYKGYEHDEMWPVSNKKYVLVNYSPLCHFIRDFIPIKWLCLVLPTLLSWVPENTLAMSRSNSSSRSSRSDKTEKCLVLDADTSIAKALQSQC